MTALHEELVVLQVLGDGLSISDNSRYLQGHRRDNSQVLLLDDGVLLAIVRRSDSGELQTGDPQTDDQGTRWSDGKT